MIEPSNFIKFLAPLVNFGALSKKSAGGGQTLLGLSDGISAKFKFKGKRDALSYQQ